MKELLVNLFRTIPLCNTLCYTMYVRMYAHAIIIVRSTKLMLMQSAQKFVIMCLLVHPSLLLAFYSSAHVPSSVCAVRRAPGRPDVPDRDSNAPGCRPDVPHRSPMR